MDAQEEKQRFVMKGWDIDPAGDKFRFHYFCPIYGSFTETVSFPAIGYLPDKITPSLVALLDVALITLGISYYKCSVQREIQANIMVTNNVLFDYTTTLYTKGMAEFYVRNHFSYPHAVRVTFQPTSAFNGSLAKNYPLDKNKAVIAFGGGKDSYVALGLVEKAGYTTQAASVVMSKKVRKKIQEAADRPINFIQRRLDPHLSDANKNGAYNGHVPITMVNSILLALYATLIGAGQIIFANERAADEATIVVNGDHVNHQFSKSLEMETIFREVISTTKGEVPNYFSVLRPFSEIWIGQKFSALKKAHDLFLSCNKNFLIQPDQLSKRWCCACPKCAFTYLILTPFFKKEDLLKIFGEDLLNKQSLLTIYEQLLGLTNQKPWECVGTIAESRTVFWRLSEKKDWQDSLMIQTLWPQVEKQQEKRALQKNWKVELQPIGDHFIPQEIMNNV